MAHRTLPEPPTNLAELNKPSTAKWPSQTVHRRGTARRQVGAVGAGTDHALEMLGQWGVMDGQSLEAGPVAEMRPFGDHAKAKLG